MIGRLRQYKNFRAVNIVKKCVKSKEGKNESYVDK